MPSTVIGAFASVNAAEAAIEELREDGFNPKEMSIFMKDQGEAQKVADDTGTNAATGAVSGATTGGIVGGLAGLLVGIGAITIPGIGPFLAAGPLAAALGLTGATATTVTGAATGAVAGGLIGALMGLGLTEDEAKVYESTIREGGVIVAVPAPDAHAEHATEILEENGAQQVKVIDVDYDMHREPATVL
jgi:uncharacterized protein YcfJ